MADDAQRYSPNRHQFAHAGSMLANPEGEWVHHADFSRMKRARDEARRLAEVWRHGLIERHPDIPDDAEYDELPWLAATRKDAEPERRGVDKLMLCLTHGSTAHSLFVGAHGWRCRECRAAPRLRDGTTAEKAAAGLKNLSKVGPGMGDIREAPQMENNETTRIAEIIREAERGKRADPALLDREGYDDDDG